ncbi:hypothetical protein H4R24_005652 [Coemansia sp. RSA 988]|nr:hypothetical protein H4R24_005652 [Coemansia sp. RSA 988]
MAISTTRISQDKHDRGYVETINSRVWSGMTSPGTVAGGERESRSPTVRGTRATTVRGGGCEHVGGRTKQIIDRLKVLVPYASVCRHRQALLQGRRGATAAASTGADNREATPAAGGGAEGDRSRKRLVEEMPAPACFACGTPADRLHVCLTCDYFGCWRRGQRPHIVEHLQTTRHPFALDFVQQQVYCSACGDYVYDASIGSWQLGTQIRWHAAVCDAAEPEAKRPRIVSTGADLSPAQAKYVREHGSVRPCGGVRGLLNLGATCFLGAVVQALAHNPLVRGWMLSDGHHPSRCRVGRPQWMRSLASDAADAPAVRDAAASAPACMACELETAFQALYSGARTPFAPVGLLHALWQLRGDLAGYGQQDAHECLVALLDTLHVGFTENVLRSAEGEAQPLAQQLHTHTHLHPCSCLVHQAFAGVLQSTVTCVRCGNATVAHDPILDISLDIPDVHDPSADVRDPLSGGHDTSPDVLLATSAMGSRSPSLAARAADAALGGWLAARHQQRSGTARKGPAAARSATTSAQTSLSRGRYPVTTLHDCLAHYTRVERLPPATYVCSRCRAPAAAATKQLCLKELPPVLTFQLKRFGHQRPASGAAASASTNSSAATANSSASNSSSSAAASASSAAAKINAFVRLPLHIDMTPYTAAAQASQAQIISGLRASGGAATSNTGNALPAEVGGVAVRDLGAAAAAAASSEDPRSTAVSRDTPIPVLAGPGGSATLGKRRTDATHSNPACAYRLFAVINHIGQLDSGHYTAYALHRGQWFLFDDATVSRASVRDVLAFSDEANVRAGRQPNGRAYMAFYVKSTLDYHDGTASSLAHSATMSPAAARSSAAPPASGMGASNTRISESGEWIEDAGVVRTRVNPNGDVKIERRGRKKGSTNAARRAASAAHASKLTGSGRPSLASSDASASLSMAPGDVPTPLSAVARANAELESAANLKKKKKRRPRAASSSTVASIPTRTEDGELDEFVAAGSLEGFGPPPYPFAPSAHAHNPNASAAAAAAAAAAADDEHHSLNPSMTSDSDSDGEALWAQISKEKAMDDLVPMLSPLHNPPSSAANAAASSSHSDWPAAPFASHSDLPSSPVTAKSHNDHVDDDYEDDDNSDFS